MKHCYTFLLTLVMTVFALTGNARTLSITLEPGSHAELQNYSGEVLFTLQEGLNTVDDGGPTSTLWVVPTNGHNIEYVKDENGKTVASQNNKKGSFPALGAFYNSSLVYTVKTVSPTMESFIVNVDDPSKVIGRLAPSGTDVNLVAGQNIINYNPYENSSFSIATPATSIYSVKADGKDVAKKWGYYESITLKPGLVIDILTASPDEEFEYTLLYSDETDFWTSITVNDKPVTITDNKFTAKYGSIIRFFNTNGPNWYINKITYPDGSVDSSKYGYLGKPYFEWASDNWHQMNATVGGNIVVDAHHIRNYDVTLNLTGVSYMTVNIGGTENVEGTTLTDLVDGENKIVLGEKECRIRIYPVGDAIFPTATFIPEAGAEEIPIPFTEDLKCYSIVQGEIGYGAVVNIVAKEKYDVANVTVDIDDPANVVAYLRYPVAGSTVGEIKLEQEFTAGENVVAVPENRDGLYFRPYNEDCIIESVTYQAPGKEEAAAEKDEATGVFYVLKPEDGSKITIKTSHTPYESSILVYLDDASKATAAVSVNSPAGRKITLNTGYNRVGFNADENEGYYGNGFIFLMPSEYGYFTAYYNGEPVEVSIASGSRKFVHELSDGDIVKIYTATATPAAHDVKFDIKGEATVSNLTTDYITPVEDLEFNALQETHVSFDVEVPEGYEYKVRLNRVDFAPVEGTENHFEFDVPATIAGKYVLINIDSTKKDENDPNKDGIETIEAAINSDAVYFDLQGRRVAALRPGLYIRKANGTAEKVIIR